jgi:hypothetical protein
MTSTTWLNFDSSASMLNFELFISLIWFVSKLRAGSRHLFNKMSRNIYLAHEKIDQAERSRAELTSLRVSSSQSNPNLGVCSGGVTSMASRDGCHTWPLAYSYDNIEALNH